MASAASSARGVRVAYGTDTGGASRNLKARQLFGDALEMVHLCNLRHFSKAVLQSCTLMAWLSSCFE